MLISGIFLFLRAFATGVTIYGVGLVISLVMDIPFWAAVLLLGSVTVVYDMLGGMKAVIISDVIQVVILLGAILAAAFMAFHMNGGWADTVEALGESRMRALDFKEWGLDFSSDGRTPTNYGFWPMFIGGFFLYLAYYGCDQTQAQRSLSTRSVDDTNRALFLGGILRFPLVLSYCLLGVGIGAYAMKNPHFTEGLVNASGETRIDLAVPTFILENFPHGMIGLVMIGLFAAAMSSLDSTINSMSAVTMHDYVLRFWGKNLSEKAELYLSKATTFFWGALAIVFSFFVGDIAQTVIVAVNKIGSVVNGPILAVFLMGMLSRRINAPGVMTGFLIGLALNTLLWFFCPGVSWLWWNLFGMVAAVVGGFAVSYVTRPPKPEQLEGNLASYACRNPGNLKGEKKWHWYYAVLTAYGVGMLVLLWNL
ncbi:sodium:solute symporter family transporter [Rubellicoccus peritrichatus]|uniref:Uncharacterized protein n=1 Tax=Rubellicoccus peritrichatus TaxID=3080537 RepID=A0AAQ3QTI9_9BACT|nr:hypothetical protein [Puniceicoccus sp. CR14]WOO43748.1 hypothetical protein RZN69_03985 [Puniceicoccus sp. CR14]